MIKQFNSRYTIVYVIITVSYFLALFYLVFFYNRVWGKYPTHHYNSLISLPFKNKFQYFLHPDRGLIFEDWFNLFKDLFGNIVLFIPYSPCLASLSRKWNPLTFLVTGLLLSVSIELTQATIGIGVFDIDDVILNTIGLSIGIFFAKKVWVTLNEVA